MARNHSWGANNDANSYPAYLDGTLVTHPSANYSNSYANGTAAKSTWGLVAANSSGNGLSQGWIYVRRGSGNVSIINVVTGGNGYSNSDTWSLTGGIGNANASGNLVTNANGLITSASVNVNGNFYTNQQNVTISTSTGAAVLSINVTAGGTTYANTNKWNLTGGVTQANGTITTNSTGGIVSTTITNGGAGFTVQNVNVAITNATGGSTGIGTGAQLQATIALAQLVAFMNGKAGRVMTEPLVAMASMTTANNLADYANFPSPQDLTKTF